MKNRIFATEFELKTLKEELDREIERSKHAESHSEFIKRLTTIDQMELKIKSLEVTLARYKSLI